MKKILWLSDIHLNFLDYPARNKFYNFLKEQNSDHIIITGDIGDAKTFHIYLNELFLTLQTTNTIVNFVLGNHDFYNGNRKNSFLLANKELKNFNFLHGKIIELSDTITLLGTSGIGDGGYGNFVSGFDYMNDYIKIQNYANKPAYIVQQIINAFLEQETIDLQLNLNEALHKYKTIYFATHVISFPEGHISRHKEEFNEGWVSHYTCKKIGDFLKSTMNQYPDKNIIILCGHSHNSWKGKITDNIYMKVAEADYYYPMIQEIIEIE